MSNSENSPVDPIAIVGISCRLPGNANSVDALWRLLESGGEAWSPVPPDRFNEEAFYHPSPDDRNGTNHHRGGHFVSGDLRDFDHSFFRLSSQQVAAMDPQQRFLLELTYEAIENAGLPLEKVTGTNTSVHVATFTADFDRNLYKDTLDLPVYYITGTDQAIMSNRISHALNLRGPSMTINTACSGGLVSLHQACKGLLDHEVDTAIVASANLTVNPDHHIGMSNNHLIGSHGRSYPFDHRGDGYGRGEGCVVLVLKRLDDALAGRDPIHAVICGTAVNQNGHSTQGIVHPNGKAQIDLIRTAYGRAGLNPRDVPYVEAHGTGTVAGDEEELMAIRETFTGPDRSLPLYVGSIKGGIGHTENTSGLASLIKGVLVLDRLVIPPVAGFEKLRPGLLLGPIRIPTECISLPQDEIIPPYVAINSFGFGGTNAHAILRKRPPYCSVESPLSRNAISRLFVFTANSQTSLTQMIEAYSSWLEEHPNTDLCNLSYTLCHRRTPLPWRFSCVAQDYESLQGKLRNYLGIKTGITSSMNISRVFVFTGQGSQWLGMGRELLLQSTPSSIFRESIRASRDVFLELGATWDLEEELLNEDAEHTLLNTAELAQPATTALQIALITLLRAQGVRPQVVVGHSSGEIAAAFAAGYLPQRTALAVAFHRGFMRKVSQSKGLPRGGMMSVGLGEYEVAPFIKGLTRGSVTVACINSGMSVTISGDADALDEVAARINTQGGIFCRRLPVDTAYHSSHMQAVARDYENRIKNLDFTANPDNDVTFVSSVSGDLKTSGFDAPYWVSNLVSPQLLPKGSNALNLFIEIGPHASLSSVTRQTLEEVQETKLKFSYSSVLKRKTEAVSSALTLAGHLFERGVQLDFDAVSALSPGFSTASVLSNLPTYAWDHSVKHWHESRISREYRMRREPYHDLLGVRIPDSTSIEPRWRHMVDLDSLPWLADHVIDGLVIFPGAGYICMVLEALLQLSRELHPQQSLETLVLRDIVFLRALVLAASPKRTEIQLSFKQKRGGQLSFDFAISALSDDKWHEHCAGTVEGLLGGGNEISLAETDDHGDVMTSPDVISIDRDEVYADLSGAGNQYGPMFMGCQNMMMLADASHTIADVEVPDVESVMPRRHQKSHLIHPTTLDIILHTALPMVKRTLGLGSIIPVRIDELLVSANTLALPRTPGSQLQVSTSLKDSHFRTAHADINVTADKTSVLSIRDMETRSMAPNNDINSHTEDICYTMAWQPDIDFMRSENFSSCHSLEDVIGHICFKHGDISIIELEGDHEDHSTTIFGMLDTQASTSASYTYIGFINTSGKSTLGKPLLEPRVRYYTTANPTVSLSSGEFQSNNHTVIVVTAIESLKHVSDIPERTGTLLMLLKKDENKSLEDLLQLIVSEAPDTLKVRSACYDEAQDRFVVTLRYDDTPEALESLKALRILTHSALDSIPSYVNRLVKDFTSRSIDVSLEQFTPEAIDSADSSSRFLVIDDHPTTILDDPQQFTTAISLLKRPADIVWLCPDTPNQMHQISGISRTAHGENSQLRLTTIHAACSILEDEDKDDRLFDIVTGSFARFTPGNNDPQPEREYRVRADGVVLVPRLRPDENLNRVIAKESGKKPERASIPELAEDEIEIATLAIGLSNTYRTAHFCEYAGVVSRVGSAVSIFAPGDRVVALGTVAGTSRPRVNQAHAVHLQEAVSYNLAAALLLYALAACHAVHRLANLKPSGHILVHGALGLAGRAVVAAARSVDAHVTVTAADAAEAQDLARHLDISIDQVLVSRPTLQRQSRDNVISSGIDVIVQASDTPIPSEALTHLKAFGSVVFMQAPLELSNVPKTLQNTTIHSCNIEGLLQARPEFIADLVSQAPVVLSGLVNQRINLCVRDMGKMAEAKRLLDTGLHSKVVLNTDDGLAIQGTTPGHTEINRWDNDNASYVISGGLGDIGRRLMILMARRGAKHFVSLSRRKVEDHDIQQFRNQLEAIRPGCKLYCFRCDVTSYAEVKKTAAALKGIRIPPVRGVIMSAVILDDRTLETMTHEDFLRVTRVKVGGTLAMEQAFMSPELEFFLTLSSSVAIVGASGQGNYNAGNTVQDSMAHTRYGTSCHFMSFNIGWIEDALATSDHGARLRDLARAGLRSIKTKQLSRSLDYVLGVAGYKERFAQSVIGFDTTSLANATDASGNSTTHSAMFRHVHKISALAGAGDSQSGQDVLSLAQAAASGNRELMLDVISNSITERLTRLISNDAIRIQRENGSILDLGLDSLVAIELRNWVMHEFKAPLQTSEILVEQTIRALAEKIAERSEICAENGKDNRKDDSRRAIDSKADQQSLDDAISAFLAGAGPMLQRRLEAVDPDAITRYYEDQVHLKRRAPLQDWSMYAFPHPEDIPTHSQTMRAALVTVAAMDFARGLASGKFTLESVDSVGFRRDASDWLFYSTRQPEVDIDRMVNFAPNETIVVLRRGHVFQLELGDPAAPLNLAAVHGAYSKIIESSEDSKPPVSILTADERNLWASLRFDLELDSQNAAVLSAIDEAAFVVCLDDESPHTPGERHSQFLLNGPHQPFANRWLDKCVQFVVTANGASGGVHEHTKLDALDVRDLHRYIVKELRSSQPGTTDLNSSAMGSYAVQELVWNSRPVVDQRIKKLQAAFSSLSSPYCPLDHQQVKFASLGRAFLRGRASPNATANLTAILALFLVDGQIRPVWETVLSSGFASGRIDWIQSISPAVRSFVEAAAAISKIPGKSPAGDASTRAVVSSLFHEAARLHSKTVAITAQGVGYVKHLYALHGILDSESEDTSLPEIFQTNAWKATRRGGPGQEVKIGFEPSDNSDYRWEEGGFLMEGERGVYIHCDVSEHHAGFSVSGRPAYTAAVCKALERAALIISNLLA
ncbi:polyketide synthase [Xylaria nigripes]|nr:polyketide synthase [Xylaria nigripes]